MLIQYLASLGISIPLLSPTAPLFDPARLNHPGVYAGFTGVGAVPLIGGVVGDAGPGILRTGLRSSKPSSYSPLAQTSIRGNSPASRCATSIAAAIMAVIDLLDAAVIDPIPDLRGTNSVKVEKAGGALAKAV